MSETKEKNNEFGKAGGEQRWFQEVLKLSGREVEAGLLSSGAVIKGKIVYTMFDSFIVESKGKPEVVRFEDLNYLLPDSSKN